MTAIAAPVAADRDQQRRGPPAEWLVGQLPVDGVPRGPFATATATPLVGFEDSAREDRAIRLEALPRDDQPKLVEAAEGSQIGMGGRVGALADGSVGHVEVFQNERVGAFILGRPRCPSLDRHANARYTLICEEPINDSCPLWMAIGAAGSIASTASTSAHPRRSPPSSRPAERAFVDPGFDVVHARLGVGPHLRQLALRVPLSWPPAAARPCPRDRGRPGPDRSARGVGLATRWPQCALSPAHPTYASRVPRIMSKSPSRPSTGRRLHSPANTS